MLAVLVDVGSIVGGAPVLRGEVVEVRNPARTREAVGTVRVADATDVEAAVAAARDAYPAWSALSPSQRAVHLLSAARSLAQAIPELSPLLVRENGKTRAQAERELARSVETLEKAAGFAGWLSQADVYRSQGRTLTILREPLGVIAVISPWNHPVGLTLKRVAPALMAGNTVVVKPPLNCPLAVTRAIELLARALPPGVLNLVNGPGGTVGKQLATHPAVKMIALTGGTDTGKQVMGYAAPTLKRLSLELGGNDPAIVLQDVTVTPELARSIVRNAFYEAGQVCFAIKRVYAPRSLYRDLVREIEAAVAEYRVGDGLDSRTTMGPLQNRKQWEWVQELAEEAKQLGATVRALGRPVEGTDWEGGYFHLPMVVSDVPSRARVVQEEQFGPILPVLPYDSLEEAIAMANETPYGLRSSVWTQDVEKGREVAARIRAGVTTINDHSFLPRECNFIGFNESGLGRESVRSGLEEYLFAHAVVTVDA